MYSFKQKICIYFSIILLAISVGINIKDIFIDDDYTINYEYVNTKDMAQPRVAEKQVSEKNIFETILSSSDNLGAVEEVDMQLESVDLPVTQGAEAAETTPKQIWYLPTEVGRISQYPNYGHVAYDITSPRGTQETIHPVANGVISGIYTDSAGALIVTVLHDINGEKYTRTTNEHGHVAFTTTETGPHNIKVNYPGNDKINPKTVLFSKIVTE